MRMCDIIKNKRDGIELTDDEIRFFIKEYTAGNIPDYQASALTMAIYFRGMTDRETLTLTKEMAVSGDMVNLSEFGNMSVDKHSTGGVGDKTSLIIAPIVASCGGKVTKMSGRGLGHTGGTIDKLESIPGYRTSLSTEEFMAQVKKVGVAVVGQSGNLTPADKKLYALRDVTATVDSIPLITSSIMSKKLAAGSHNIVLDVKVGSGAFMKTPEEARILAEKMVRIGKMSGRNIRALITDMDSPLGDAVGNALEVIEAVDVLKNGKRGHLRDICLALTTNMLSLIYGIDDDEAYDMARDAIDSKRAYEKMKEWIAAQGGDVRYIEDVSLFKKSKYSAEVLSKEDGYILSMNAEAIGNASIVLGAGRAYKEDTIDHSAGIIISKTKGDRVKRGDVLCTLYSDRQDSLDPAAEHYLSAIRITKEKPQQNPLVYTTVK